MGQTVDRGYPEVVRVSEELAEALIAGPGHDHTENVKQCIIRA